MTVDTFPKDGSDDADLDALMIRVREAAMAGVANGGAAPAQAAGDPAGRDVDLVRLIDAQSEWNEQTRKSLAALVDCLRTLRDDWTDAQARQRQEIGQLSALVAELRTATEAAMARTNQAADESTRTRPASATPRGARKRQSTKGGRRQS